MKGILRVCRGAPLVYRKKAQQQGRARHSTHRRVYLPCNFSATHRQRLRILPIRSRYGRRLRKSKEAKAPMALYVGVRNPRPAAVGCRNTPSNIHLSLDKWAPSKRFGGDRLKTRGAQGAVNFQFMWKKLSCKIESGEIIPFYAEYMDVGKNRRRMDSQRRTSDSYMSQRLRARGKEGN